LENLLNTDFDFIVSCVNKDSINETAQMLANRGVPFLTETPVTDGNLKETNSGCRTVPLYASKSGI
jgi:hypothetical protein